jgi:hypothetical protein
LGVAVGLVMEEATQAPNNLTRGIMADDETFLTSPPTPEMAHHVRDYTRVMALLKYGAIVCFIIALVVMFLIS